MLAETDLRETLRRVAADAPDADDALESLLARLGDAVGDSRRPRRFAVAAAVAAVLVVVVSLAALLGGRASNSRSPVQQSPDRPATVSRAALVPAWHFTTGRVAGYRVSRDSFIRVGPVTWVQESAAVTAVRGRESGRIVVQEHSPGGWAAQRAQQLSTPGRRTSIDGRAAYFTYGRPLVADAADAWSAAAADPDHQPELIWQLPGGAWAMVGGTFGFRPDTRSWDQTTALTDLRRLAGSVDYGRRTAVDLPFRLAHEVGLLVPATVREFPQAQAYCLGLAASRSGAATIDGKGAAALICRGPARSVTAADDRYRQLVDNDPVLASRDLPDGSVLQLIGSAKISRLTAAAARAVLAGIDTTPSPARASTWLAVH